MPLTKFVCSDCDKPIANQEECKIHVQSTAATGMMHIVDEINIDPNVKTFKFTISCLYTDQVEAKDIYEAREKAIKQLKVSIPYASSIFDDMSVESIERIKRGENV